MSTKSSLVKMAIKYSPKATVIWVGNKVLKGIAELTDFHFDLETRSVYAKAILQGETDEIEVWLDDFAVITEDGIRKFIVQQAKSNKPWLNNIFARIVGKAWKIPAIPQLTDHIDLITELLHVTPNADNENANDSEDDLVVPTNPED